MNVKLPNTMKFVQHRTKLFNAFVNQFIQYARRGHPSVTPTCSQGIEQYHWPSSKLSVLNQPDKHFILPGDIGLQEFLPNIRANIDNKSNTATTTTTKKNSSALLMKYEIPASNLKYIPPEDTEPSNGCILPDYEILECIAQAYPMPLRKTFSSLFSDHNIMEGEFTIITITQHTLNDMATYSRQVAEEREKLHQSFMDGAKTICESLQNCGFWANYLDTSTGKMYFEQNTEDAMYETDDRYRLLGFEMEDLICCKAISHHKWGTHSYVGCLFTNVPCNHDLLQGMAYKTLSHVNNH